MSKKLDAGEVELKVLIGEITRHDFNDNYIKVRDCGCGHYHYVKRVGSTTLTTERTQDLS